jgi:peroxiredoxin Q/BCP
MYQVGDSVKDFTLPNHLGEMVTLSSYLGKKVLIWFYPKASTPGCTAEGCSLRDNFSALSESNLVVMGISKDSVKRQSNFVTKHNFPYDLLADTEGVVVEDFGAWGPKKFMGREYEGIIRSSYLINEQGEVEHVFAKVKTKTHGDDVLALLSNVGS